MNQSGIMEPKPARKSLFGLGFLGGMLALSFIQSALQMSLTGCMASLLGLLAVVVFHRWMERDIPIEVDTIATQVSQWPEDRRKCLRDYLRDQ